MGKRNKSSSPPLLHQASSSTLVFHSARESYADLALPIASFTSVTRRHLHHNEDHPGGQRQQQVNRDGNGSDDDEEEESAIKHPGALLLLIFLGYGILLYLVYLSFPTMTKQERQHMKLPLSMQDAKKLANVLDSYSEKYYWTVLSGFALVFLFLQTFAMPGSIFLSIMAGFLFPFWTALSLICFCSASGASCCYLLSWLVGRPLVEQRFPEVIRSWTEKVEEERDNLFNFIVFLRITPILPNWLINIVAPLIGVPLKPFWFGTFVGVAPPAALAVQAGRTLNLATSPTDHISWWSIIVLTFIALLALIPVVIRRLQA